jgi:hypothetical protein
MKLNIGDRSHLKLSKAWNKRKPCSNIQKLPPSNAVSFKKMRDEDQDNLANGIKSADSALVRLFKLAFNLVAEIRFDKATSCLPFLNLEKINIKNWSE